MFSQSRAGSSLAGSSLADPTALKVFLADLIFLSADAAAAAPLNSCQEEARRINSCIAAAAGGGQSEVYPELTVIEALS